MSSSRMSAANMVCLGGALARGALACTVLVLAVPVAAGPVSPAFSRYEIILARKPFGDEPPTAAGQPAAPGAGGAAAAAESLAKTLQMCAITRNQRTGVVQVGLVNTQAKKNYFLAVGESEDGIEVVEADYEGERALLRKDGQEYWISMSEVVPAGPAAPSVATPAAASAVPVARFRGTNVVMVGRVRGGTIRRPDTEQPKLSGEALEKHLQELQMNLIRARGALGPPLPMELTPEIDAQLVKEGVLPPLEE